MPELINEEVGINVEGGKKSKSISESPHLSEMRVTCKEIIG